MSLNWDCTVHNLAWLRLWSINIGYTKLAWFFPKSDQVCRKFLCFLKSRHAELTKIGHIFTELRGSKIEVIKKCQQLKFLLIHYSQKKIIFRKLESIFDTVKWSGKSEFSHFWSIPHSSISKNEKFLSAWSFLSKNYPNFAYPILIFHNQYVHTYSAISI